MPLDALASALGHTAAMLRAIEADLATASAAPGPALQQIDQILQRLDALAFYVARLAPGLPPDASHRQMIADLPLESLRDEPAFRPAAPPRPAIELF